MPFIFAGHDDPEADDDGYVYIPCADELADTTEISLEHPGVLSNLPHDA